MVTLMHPTGNANVRAVLNGLYSAQMLSSFYTGIASFPGTLFDSLGNFGLFSELKRRRFDKELKAYTHSLPYVEAARLFCLRAGFSDLVKHETGRFSIDAVYHHLDLIVSKALGSQIKKGVKAVYCYEDGAMYTFEKARQSGITTLYDLPIGYWRSARRFLQKEQERWPEWSSTLTGLKDSDEKLQRKDNELRLSDAIFVASSFTKRTLDDYPGTLAPVHVVPYGFPQIGERREHLNLVNKRKIKLLFVGGLSQRKGIADLFTAVNGLEKYIELTVVGRKTTSECAALDFALSKHKWIPSLPHQEVLALMRQQDILVFPSLFEGFGLVITEAMSQGLPVITTDRTAGPDLIEHGRNGWLVEAGSPYRLKAAIEHFIEQPSQIQRLGTEAQEAASLRPWSVYGAELLAAMSKIIHHS